MMKLVRSVLFLVTLSVMQGAPACTIFVLTDATRTLFCNNEDFSNPNTRIWFVPGGKDHFGCVYVGFDDGVEQGGSNTRGLAFDAVAGYKEDWSDTRKLSIARGNPMARMLETCSTVEESISFFKNHRFPWFSAIKMLVADRTGRSVILGASNGKLQVEESRQCRGLGYGQPVLEKMLKTPPEPTVDNGIAILRASFQDGDDATKYSNIFDLKSGDIFLFPRNGDPKGVKFNLLAELRKGPHYFDMREINQQLSEAPRPLLDNMKRLFIDRFKPIQDREPDVTQHFRQLIKDTVNGQPQPSDYTAEFWDQIKPRGLSPIADERSSAPWGERLTLVDRRKEGGNVSYRYRVEFADAVLLLRFVIQQKKVSLVELEGMQLVYF